MFIARWKRRTADCKDFYAAVRDYGDCLGIKVEYQVTNAFIDWLRLWRKLWLCASTKYFGAEKTMRMLDIAWLIGIRMLWLTILIGRGSYLNYSPAENRLRLRAPKFPGIVGLLTGRSQLLSGYICVYVFLVAYHCRLVGLTDLSLHTFLVNLYGPMCVWPDGDIMVGGIGELRRVPSQKRLEEFDGIVTGITNSDPAAFALLRDAPRPPVLRRQPM